MITVNAMGDTCPIPVIKTKKALEETKGLEEVEVLVDNETAIKNVTKMAESLGASAVHEKTGEGAYTIRITPGQSGVKEAGTDVKPEEICCPECAAQKGLVVSISSDRMGSGDDELGRVLMKGFLFALTQLDRLPETILFYNGGAKLTTEGSASLEDLKKMEEQGTVILTCGTCLDFYGIKDKLAVGTVTNMYSIAETLQKAEKIIRP